jgi:Fe-S-cluster containining protein
MRRVRIAILGNSPCERCTAACCKQNGHDYAALLVGGETRKFAPFAIDVKIRAGHRIVTERVLPYVNGRCTFLGADDRCTIYEDRPDSCRAFECVVQFNRDGTGQHGEFLHRNVEVREMLESLQGNRQA